MLESVIIRKGVYFIFSVRPGSRSEQPNVSVCIFFISL